MSFRGLATNLVDPSEYLGVTLPLAAARFTPALAGSCELEKLFTWFGVKSNSLGAKRPKPQRIVLGPNLFFSWS